MDVAVYTGLNAQDGRSITGESHLHQSVRDILTTPLGSRVMRREYGSRLYQLLATPINQETLALIRAYTAAAIARWEPRITLSRVTTIVQAGRVSVDLIGTYEGREILLSGIGL